jgi:hypothetical protein
VKTIVKKTLITIGVILLIITLLIISGIVVGKIYKDEVRNYLISQINSEIEVKVNVSSAEFSVLRKFPYISIELNDVFALSGKGFDRSQFSGISTDTLFTASRIYMQFNLLDIIHKEYRLIRVHAVKGKINIFVDKQGSVNYRIFKADKRASKSNINLELDAVKLSGFSWQFLNLAKEIQAEGKLKELTLKGKFSQRNFSLNSRASIFIKTFFREGIEYASKIELGSRLTLTVHDSVYAITRGELSLNELNYKIGGSFILGSKTIMDLQVGGENLNIQSLVSMLPVNKETIGKYSLSGKVGILAKVKGEISSTVSPSIRAAFKVSNGNLVLPVFAAKINIVALRGTFSNGSLHNASTSRVVLNEYSITFGNSQLNGELNIDNLNSPFLSGTLSGTIIAKELSDFLKVDRLKLKQGFIYPELSVNVSLDSFSNFHIQNILGKSLNGKLGFKEISGQIPYSELPLDLLEGSIRMEGETWFPQLQIKLGKNRFSADLIVNYFWEYLVNNSKIPEINGEIVSEYLSVTDFYDKNISNDETDFQLPDSIYLNLHCKVDSFIYGKFLASDFETWFTYQPRLLRVSSFKMQTMKGSVSAGGAIIADNQGQMLLQASGELHHIDIFKLFNAFNNFGQEFIVAGNLKGSATGKLDFSACISPKLVILTREITAQSDFVIENGELINFEPVTALSSFVELAELQHIKFSTLKNSILIKDEKVYIPQMDINSSAFNLTISGTHGFDNNFVYNIRLSLSEFLAGKAKRAKRENEEFGIIEDDGAGNTNLYLTITGIPDNFKIKYDKKEAINKVKTDLKDEKKLLKTILKEELGLFKNDTVSVGSKNKKTDEKPFIMDWKDEKTPSVEPVRDEKDKKMKKKDPAFKVTWEAEDTDL